MRRSGYKIEFSMRARTRINQIKKNYSMHVREALFEIKNDPFIGKPLGRELTRQYSYRIGMYRIIYKIDRKNKKILVLTCGHRGKVYS